MNWSLGLFRNVIHIVTAPGSCWSVNIGLSQFISYQWMGQDLHWLYGNGEGWMDGHIVKTEVGIRGEVYCKCVTPAEEKGDVTSLIWQLHGDGTIDWQRRLNVGQLYLWIYSKTLRVWKALSLSKSWALCNHFFPHPFPTVIWNIKVWL